jgi:hypothetical protein
MIKTFAKDVKAFSLLRNTVPIGGGGHVGDHLNNGLRDGFTVRVILKY